MKGVYQHCSEKHLHRYVAEFEFRYNNRVALGCDDAERSVNALLGTAILAFGYWANQFWLMCLGAFGIAVGIYRFAAHLSQWRRASKSN